MKQYNINDTPYLASYSSNLVKLKCPACFGNRQLKVILGDNTEVFVPCEGCEAGYQGALGYIQEYEWVKSIEKVKIKKIDGEMTENGFKVEKYVLDNDRHIYADDNSLFDTFEEAEFKVSELIEQQEKAKMDSIKYKKDKIGKVGWHIRYHSRQIKELEDKLNYHRKLLIINKEKEKDK